MNLQLITKLKNYTWKSLKKLGNLTFAISLFFYIASLSIIGTIIEQNQNLQFYINTYSEKNKILWFFDWKIIKDLQLDHVYTTWWFISSIIVFGASLTICTLSKQLPMLKSARRWRFYSSRSKILGCSSTTTLTSPSLFMISFILQQHHYHVFQQKNKIYAYSGLIGRVAPIFVHISIILLLFGSILSFIGGVLLQEIITVGETVHPQNIITSGKVSYLEQEFIIHISNFSIKYNPDISVRQFISYTSILNFNNQLISKQILQVNTPMYFRSLTIYQTDWDIIAIRLKLNKNVKIQISCQEFTYQNHRLWVSVLKVSKNSIIYIIIPNFTGKLYIYNNEGNLIKSIYIHDTVQVKNVDISFENFLARTGLQIKTDPGNSIIYFSFGILILSTLFSYVSYSQLWIIYFYNNSYLGGVTNRAYLDFEEDIKKIESQSMYAMTKLHNREN
uniref:Cytochrome c biogenesis protein CcsB n=1 Tax=Apophlaea sinclairii TaxID=212746 RepID=A0A1C9CBS2_9FLOR|nr:c-type cytochrome biogenensis protein [Apophlaea sinclairii]AOM65843.1 c-type cytochrome biogenensis protein [Apophlaea sinclairii]